MFYITTEKDLQEITRNIVVNILLVSVFLLFYGFLFIQDIVVQQTDYPIYWHRKKKIKIIITAC